MTEWLSTRKGVLFIYQLNKMCYIFISMVNYSYCCGSDEPEYEFLLWEAAVWSWVRHLIFISFNVHNEVLVFTLWQKRYLLGCDNTIRISRLPHHVAVISLGYLQWLQQCQNKLPHLHWLIHKICHFSFAPHHPAKAQQTLSPSNLLLFILNHISKISSQ